MVLRKEGFMKRQYKVIATIDWVINFKQEFNIKDVRFYSEECKMYAEVNLEEEDFRKVQCIAYQKIKNACGALSHLEKYIINFKLVRVHEIDSFGEKVIPINGIIGYLVKEKELTEEVIKSASLIQELAFKYPKVEQYLQYLFSDEYYTWYTLYKVYELIDKDVNIVEKGWVSNTLKGRFTRTANNPSVSGLDSRHAVSTTDPPKKPMDIDEAANFIKDIADKWLKYYEDLD